MMLHVPGWINTGGCCGQIHVVFILSSRITVKFDILEEKLDGNHMKSVIGANQSCDGGVWSYRLELCVNWWQWKLNSSVCPQKIACPDDTRPVVISREQSWETHHVINDNI